MYIMSLSFAHHLHDSMGKCEWRYGLWPFLALGLRWVAGQSAVMAEVALDAIAIAMTGEIESETIETLEMLETLEAETLETLEESEIGMTCDVDPTTTWATTQKDLVQGMRLAWIGMT